MASFWGELRRRNVLRVGIAYLAAVWVLIQVADVVLPVIEAPPWILQVLVSSCALGFPLVLILAWFYELTPEGVKATDDVEVVEAVKFTGRKIDFAIIGLLVLAVAFLLVRSPFDNQTAVLPNSVAVLPFENLSPDPDNAYFAAGIHEEILNRLAQLSALNVIARTSVVRYAEEKLPISEIATALNVQTVMEGSVRYAGDRVRVTTQLIEARTGTHLWSETYDREFSDIFAVESDIATNVANSLEAEFSLTEQQTIEKLPTNSPEAYALYLRALTAGDGLGAFSSDLDRAIELDPEFALAYAQKAWDYSAALNYSVDVISPAEVARTGRQSAERALELDPTVGLAHIALASIAVTNWRWVEARQHAERAYELKPNHIDVISQLGRILRNEGEYVRAIRILERGTILDPNNPFAFQQLGLAYRVTGNYEAAIANLEKAIALNPVDAGYIVNLAMAEVYRGNSDEAVSRLRVAEQLMEGRPTQFFRYGQMGIVYAKAGRREDVERLFAALEERATETDVGDANWAYIHIALGEHDLAFELLEAAMETPTAINYTALMAIKINDWRDPELEEPRFQQVLSGLWSE